MGWFARYREKAERAQHRVLAWATVSVALSNVALWGLQPFGPDHIGAGLVLILALTLCYFKYWKR
jgi:hypothetical protein